MKLSPLSFFKCLSDDTRLRVLLLLETEEELCVCELTQALQLIQPKISRHLAQLRDCGLLKDRREGQWVFYRINPDLPVWAQETLRLTANHNLAYIKSAQMHLQKMGDRPQRTKQCC